MRRLTVSNPGPGREIEVTSYAELVLAPPAADIAHPAFSKLFVETEHLPAVGALLAHRRRRSPTSRRSGPRTWRWSRATTVGKREFETDRARFIGRDGTISGAASGDTDGRPLSGSVGTVLDPSSPSADACGSRRGRPRASTSGPWRRASRAEIMDLIDKHHDRGAFGRAAALAWTQVQVQLHHLGIDRGQAAQFQRLAGHVLYADARRCARRPKSSRLVAAGSHRSGGLGISGDLPIVLVRIADIQEIGLAREVLLAVEYWRLRRLPVDLVLLNERATSYVQDLQAALETLVRANQSRAQLGDEPGGGHVFLLRADLVPEETRAILGSVARVVLVGERGRLADQLENAPEARMTSARPPPRVPAASQLQVARPAPELEYFNGLGGFADDGREYVTILGPGQRTPAPWINVIANPDFGFQVSAEGAATPGR